MKRIIALMICMALLASHAWAEDVDVVASASRIYYQDSSLSLDELQDAMDNSLGACTVATVNDDGSPLLVSGSPGMLKQTHIVFGWNNNVTLANIERDGQAMLCYYLFDPTAQTKTDRHRGARLRLSLETDASVVADLYDSYPSLPFYATIMKIDELLPLG